MIPFIHVTHRTERAKNRKDSQRKTICIINIKDVYLKISFFFPPKKIRMPTFIKAKLKNSYYQTNIDKHRVAANIIHIKINLKFTVTRQKFHVKNIKIYIIRRDELIFLSQL